MKSKKEERRGGIREGSGRPSFCHNKKRVLMTISQETLEMVDETAQGLGMSRSDLIDSFLFLYLKDSKDIIKCPHCGKPMLWTSLVPDNGSSCKVTCRECGETYQIELSTGKVI